MDYRESMHDPQLAWRFGRWIGRREDGAARLSWNTGELILRVHQGRIVSAEGTDPGELLRKLGCQGTGSQDLMEEARFIAGERNIPETQVMGAAKEILQRSIHAWLSDPGRDLEIVDGTPDTVPGASISITHAIVELVLSDVEHNVAGMVLPDLGVLLRRSNNFLELYGPLRLSEEADLIVAKITGQRTAEEISDRSPHGQPEVLRLLAALVATGMLEAIPVVRHSEEMDLLADALPEAQPARKRLPVGWIMAGAAALAVILAVLGLVLSRAAPEGDAAQPETGTWGVVIDMGCDPQDLQRMLKKRNEHPKVLRPLPVTPGSDDCIRLVWGSFPSRSEAEKQLLSVPRALQRDGFEPHVVLIAEDSGGEPERTDTP
jgi:hypothetical protein